MAEEVFESPELTQAMAETESGERVFDVDGFGVLKIRFPNAREAQEADMMYSEKFTELLDGNLKTNIEMEDLLKRRGIWTDEHDKQVQRLQGEIQDAYEAHAKAKNRKARQKAIDDREKAREKLQELNMRKQQLMANTIESKCDDIRTAYLITKVTRYAEDDKPVWPTYDDYLNESNSEAQGEVIRQWITFSMGIPSNFLDTLQEEEAASDDDGEADGE